MSDLSRLPRTGAVVVPAVVVPAALLVLAGCGGSSDPEPSTAPATVTVTASVPAPDAGASETPGGVATPSADASASAAPSGDPAALPRQERGHDVVLVASHEATPAGVVLTFDRLTVVGVPDEQLAAGGTPIRVDDGTAFTNQAQRLYEAGVSPQARFYLTTCTRTASGPTIASEEVDVDTFLADPGLQGTAVSLRYADGLVERAETNPRC